MKYKKLESIYFPEGYYVSKTEAAKWVGMNSTSLQYHIKTGRLPTIFLAGAHHINVNDLIIFQEYKRDAPVFLDKFEDELDFIDYLRTHQLKPNMYGPNLHQQVEDWLTDNNDNLSNFSAAQKEFNSYMGWTAN